MEIEITRAEIINSLLLNIKKTVANEDDVEMAIANLKQFMMALETEISYLSKQFILESSIRDSESKNPKVVPPKPIREKP